MRDEGQTQVQEIFEAFALMGAVDALDIVVDLPAETIVDIRVISLLLIVPENRPHLIPGLSLELLSQELISRFDSNTIQLLMNAVEELLHELMRVFLIPVDEQHAEFG